MELKRGISAPTFATLREVETKVRCDKSATVVRAEKNVLQRIITAFDAGRKIDLLEILSHELTNVLWISTVVCEAEISLSSLRYFPVV
jgi:hypothetical protein